MIVHACDLHIYIYKYIALYSIVEPIVSRESLRKVVPRSMARQSHDLRNGTEGYDHFI